MRPQTPERQPAGRAPQRLRGRRVLLRLPVALVYLAGIVWLCATPARDLARVGLSSAAMDVVHIPLFVGLTWVSLWVFDGPVRARIAVVLAACLAFAALAEWLQASVPGRVASLGDLRANAAGVLIGVVLFEGPRALVRKRKPS